MRKKDFQNLEVGDIVIVTGSRRIPHFIPLNTPVKIIEILNNKTVEVEDFSPHPGSPLRQIVSIEDIELTKDKVHDIR